MKKTLFYIGSSLFVLVVVLINLDFNNINDKNNVAVIKETHKMHLENSPFKETKSLSKKERKKLQIAPRAYYEDQWELTMDPVTGRPAPEKIREIREQLKEERASLEAARTPGSSADNSWIERGPNNVGGRVRAIMFDPNDTSDEIVFAGGVSGGLWKNSNISNAASEWQRVDLGENLHVTNLTFDPNDTNTFYMGTGESYTGDTWGNGLWKSTDAGATWTQVLGGREGDSEYVAAAQITVNSPSSVAGNYDCVHNNPVNFGVEITAAITADAVVVDDGTALPTEGCSPLVNGSEVNGKIALVRRANCNFTEKVKNAQNAGAIACIIMNNVAGPPIPMGGEDATVTIPSVMVSEDTGDALEAVLNSGSTVNLTISPSVADFNYVNVSGLQFVNDVVVLDNNGSSEIYASSSYSSHPDSNQTTLFGYEEAGVYKSVDGGANWIEMTIPLAAEGFEYMPYDLEVAADNTIWMTTTTNGFYVSETSNGGAGKVFKSNDGTSFTEIYDMGTNARRTELAASKQNAGKMYVMSDTGTGVLIKKTTSGFVPSFGVQTMSNPSDFAIGGSDFTNGQAFYDLVLEVDPTNDNTVYAGGISFHRTTNAATWTQITRGYGSNALPYAHPDQHGVAFGSNTGRRVFANDGGVYFSESGSSDVQARNNEFNVTQFYSLAVAPKAAFPNKDVFVAGSQDNGTQFFDGTNEAGTDGSVQSKGGDGAYCMFDQDGTDQYYIANYVYNDSVEIFIYNPATDSWDSSTINNETASNGDFINVQCLDSNLDIVYSNFYDNTANESRIMRYSNIKGSVQSQLITDEEMVTSVSTMEVSPYTTTSSTLVVGTRLGNIFIVTNADGASPTFTGIDGNAFTGSISDIEFGASENELFVTLYNFGVPNIWYTNDQGATWENKEGNLPDLPVRAILQNPLNLEEVIVATELGVWTTSNFSDASPSWTQSFNGMSDAIVTDLDLRDDNKVFAATYGRGVFSGDFTAEATFSVEEEALAGNFTVYPNPSNGTFQIQSVKLLDAMELNIYDINGRAVYKQDISFQGDAVTVNAGKLATGVYVLNIKGEAGINSQKLIIK